MEQLANGRIFAVTSSIVRAAKVLSGFKDLYMKLELPAMQPWQLELPEVIKRTQFQIWRYTTDLFSAQVWSNSK